jgi:predicted small integral membrane protein
MLIIRYTKIAMAASLAAFCLLVAFDNITDYGTNYLFVQHVMSMDTTYPGNALMYRAVTNPVLWNLVYKLIIIAEALTGILFLAGAICLFQLRGAPARAFNEGKALVVAGGLVAFLLWFVGFMVIAGEWFAMWQSATWNGQDAAFRFCITVLAVLIFVNLPDADLLDSALERGLKPGPEPKPGSAPKPQAFAEKRPTRSCTDTI